MSKELESFENISYAKTVYGQQEIDAVVKCLNESTQMGNYSRKFEKKIASLFDKKESIFMLTRAPLHYILELRPIILIKVQK